MARREPVGVGRLDVSGCVGILDGMLRRRARRRPSGIFIVVLLMALVVAGCTGTPAPDATTGPDQQLAAFVAAWEQGNTDKAADLTDDSAAAALLLDDVTRNLQPTALRITPGPITRTGDQASATVTVAWELPDAGTWTYPANWTWRRSAGGSGDWLLDWSPTVVHPKLGERQTMAIRTSAGTPGALVDRNNVQIVSPVRVYSVVLRPDGVPDLTATAQSLATILAPFDAGITAKSIVDGAARPVAKAAGPSAGASGRPAPGASAATPSVTESPTAAGDPAAPVGYTVINLREGDFQKVKARLAAIDGLSFPSEERDLPPTRDFARALLGEVTPVASKLTQGTGGWKIITVDSTGGALETLMDVPAVAGKRVTLTLDSGIQQAAESALTGIGEPAVLLAMQPSSGEILAVAQNAAANAQGAPALTGRYPPGSTFKVVTATAALDRGLIAPGRPVQCPGTTRIDGRLVRNFDDFDLGTVDSSLAFAKSCNTTFATVASKMPDQALTAAAKDYGIGLDFVVDGITTLTGAVPPAATTVQRAENGFGQGQVLVTPFSSLLMAATAANGTMPMPVLIRGTRTTVDAPAPERSATVVTDIQGYMRAVVQEGTGVVLQPFGDVHAKTGTAEFTAADGTVHAHAWTVGYRGDLAFAALIVGGEESSRTNKVLASFLGAVPGG